jgi:hypothetical protein
MWIGNMDLRKIFILLFMLPLIILSIAACTSNQVEGQQLPSLEEPEKEGQQLPPPPPPVEGNPKLESNLRKLILAESQEEAEAFARPRGIELVDGSVRVSIECVPGQVDAAAKIVGTLGTVEIISHRFNGIRALVPIASLNTLADEESIKNIQLPVHPVPCE